ncbi:MAG: DUF2834 domain-containing protein [Myxococcales bacterium]|nr:DUF2834 domain-containing protein [Myxococcales bacterium]
MYRIALYAVFALFTAFSLWVTWEHGYLAFLDVPTASPWGLQITLDLVIAVSLFTFWMIPDARRHGIPSWPYLLACVSVGSIGALGYLVHRSFRVPKPLRESRAAP